MDNRPEKPSAEMSDHEGTLTVADQKLQGDFNYVSGWRLHTITAGKVILIKSPPSISGT